MKITKKIKLGTNYYYVVVDVQYKKEGANFPVLCLKNYKDDYWDGGDFSILIKEIEKSYTREKSQKYDANISFMADILYIYDRIPFLSGINDIYPSQKDNIPHSVGYISKDEIDKYIKDFNIQMNNNPNFKLVDARTWKL